MEDDRIGPYVEPQDEPTPRLIRQMVVQNKSVADSGHRRHSEAIRQMVERLIAVETRINTHAEKHAHVEELLNRPVEASTILWDTKTILAAAALCLSIIGGSKWSTAGFQDKLEAQTVAAAAQAAETRIINVKMDALKQHEEDATKLQEATNATVQRELTRIGGQNTMIDTKLSNLMITRR